jgi:hypothetical protein
MMAGVSIVCGARANAQTAQESNPHVISNQDLDLLRKDIRSKKKQLVAVNLKYRGYMYHDQYHTSHFGVPNALSSPDAHKTAWPF